MSSGTAIIINTNQVTLDLNGFTLSSTEATPTGTGILLAGGNSDITIRNGRIAVMALRITAEGFTSGGASANLTWDSVPTRFYYLQKATNLTTQVWLDSGLGLISPAAGPTTAGSFTDTLAPMRFHRVQAELPLSP